MNKTLKRVIITVVSLVTAAAVGVGAFSIVKKNQKQNLTAQVTPVSMMYTQYYEDNYRYGYVQSGFTQNVFAQEGAVIQEIYVQQGQEVKTGDPLLTYDPEQIQLELDRKELNIQVLQRRYERLLNELYELQNTKPSDASSLYGASAGNGMTASLRDETTPGESSASEESSKAEESSVQEESSESKPEESSESKPEESSESKPEESSESKPEESSESKPEESSESKPEESSGSKPEESSESKPEESSESKPEESSESKPEESSES
ncbi:MAG: biotin/lipoyl-binding protein, partial [Firmicutes bacterium]|nr:biotin/lipoyl-binding protein [Bacillota bacterium]